MLYIRSTLPWILRLLLTSEPHRVLTQFQHSKHRIFIFQNIVKKYKYNMYLFLLVLPPHADCLFISLACLSPLTVNNRYQNCTCTMTYTVYSGTSDKRPSEIGTTYLLFQPHANTLVYYLTSEIGTKSCWPHSAPCSEVQLYITYMYVYAHVHEARTYSTSSFKM